MAPQMSLARMASLAVCTKCLAKEDINNAVKEDSTGSLSDIAAEKIAHDCKG
jgi:hypothetical protein